MGFQYSAVVYYFVLCVAAIGIVEPMELRRIPVKVCCNSRINIPDPTQIQPSLAELLHIANENLKTSSLTQMEQDPFTSAAKFNTPPPISEDEDDLKAIEDQKAYFCSKMNCPQTLLMVPVCACNFKTGKVVTFKNKCDMKKHNCRFDTAFKVILEEICPWEFVTRRRERTYEYTDPQFFN